MTGEEEAAAAEQGQKPGPVTLSVNVEINIAEIICAILLPPTVTAIVLAVVG